MSEPPIPEASPDRRLSEVPVPGLASTVIGVFAGCAFADWSSGGFISAYAILVPGLVVQGIDGWPRLVLAGLVHGDVLDLLQNAFLALATIPLLERIFGRARTLALLVVATLTASAFSMALFPADAVACASGAVFGAVGLLLGVLTLRRGLLPDHIETRLVVLIAVGVIGEAIIGLFSPLVNNGMHLGGFLAGLLLTCVLEPRAAMPAAPKPMLGALHGVVLLVGLGVALVLGVDRSKATLPHALLEASHDFEVGRVEQAIATMEAALVHPPRGSAEVLFQPVAQNSLAWFYVKTRREIAKAIALSEASNAKMERRPEFLDTLGYLYALAGDCRKAADAMGRAAEIDPAYTRRRNEVIRACEQGRPADPDIPVEKPIEGLPTGPGIAA